MLNFVDDLYFSCKKFEYLHMFFNVLYLFSLLFQDLFINEVFVETDNLQPFV